MSMEMNWIPVEDRVPDSQKNVLVWCGCYVDVASYQRGGFWVFGRDTGFGFELGSVTHWMEMPEGPEEE